jgi:four helix bundle protein
LLQCIIWGARRASTRGVDMQASKAVELQRRLIVFAGRIVSLSFKLRRTAVGRHIANQIVRCGTATAANYAEARAAESRSDFIHKLRIVLKELNETDVWLQLILETSLIDAPAIAGIVAENQELCRIFAASIKTARELQART